MATLYIMRKGRNRTSIDNLIHKDNLTSSEVMTSKIVLLKNVKYLVYLRTWLYLAITLVFYRILQPKFPRI